MSMVRTRQASGRLLWGATRPYIIIIATTQCSLTWPGPGHGPRLWTATHGTLFPSQCENAAEAVPSTPTRAALTSALLPTVTILPGTQVTHTPTYIHPTYIHPHANVHTLYIHSTPLSSALVFSIVKLCVVGGLGFEFCVFVAGWRHALRSEWPLLLLLLSSVLLLPVLLSLY